MSSLGSKVMLKKNWTQIDDTIRRDVEVVHAFISAWIRGDIEHSKTAFEKEFATRFAKDFVNIQPAGSVLGRADLVSSIEDRYGANPDFHIGIRHCTLRRVWKGETTALATYVEDQQGAKNTIPANNSRISSLLVRFENDINRPTWLHLHESRC